MRTAKKVESKPVPPRPYARAESGPGPAKADGKPIPPKPLAVRPFMRPFAMVQLPRMRPALPTHVLGSSNAEIPRQELFATNLTPTMPWLGARSVPLPSSHMSLPPSSSPDVGATVPSPPPSMTGAIILDEWILEERVHMTGSSIIPANLGLELAFAADDLAPISLAAEDLIEEIMTTGTIDVDESWFEESLPIELHDIAPESFWMRGTMHARR